MSDVLEELVTKFVYDVDQVGLRKYEAAQKKINKNTKEMIGLNSTLAKGIKKLFLGFGIGFGALSMAKTYEQLDLTRRSIEGLTKSTQDWAYVQNEAFRTATDIEVVAKGYRNFFAAANMAGFDKNGIQEMYSGILVSARAIGATSQQTEGALLALEQMISKGVVSMEELRRQLGNALPGAFEIGAKAMNMTTQEFNKLVKTGKLASKEFVPKFVKTYLDEFGGGFGEAMKSANAAIVRLRISWKQFIMTVGDTGAGAEIAKGLNYIAEFLRSPDAVNIAKGIGIGLQMVAKALGLALKHIRLILILLGINMLAQLPSLFGKITKALAVFNKELLLTSKAGLLIMKNFWWVFAIAAVLTTIGLALQDIYMYLTDPNALTLTKQLAAKSPEFAKAMERFRDGIKAVSDIWQNSLYPAVKNLIDAVVIWAGGDHSTLGTIFEWILTQIGKLLGALGDVLLAIQKIDEANPFSDRNKKIKEARGRVSKGIGWDNFILRPSVLAKGKGTQQLKQLFSVIPNAAPFAPSPNLYGGYNLQKTETYAPQNTNYINVNATNRSDNEIISLFNKALNGQLDAVNSQISFTPYFNRN